MGASNNCYIHEIPTKNTKAILRTTSKTARVKTVEKEAQANNGQQSGPQVDLLRD